MTQFAVGDQVRVNFPRCRWHRSLGTVRVISPSFHEGGNPLIRVVHDDDTAYYYWPHELEPAAEPRGEKG
jgi:hypothetical protein